MKKSQKIAKEMKCPICDYEGKFKSFGLAPRRNAYCPQCHSLERHRLIWLYLKNKTNFFQKKLKVLHFGPNAGLLNRFKKLSNLEYKFVNINQKKIEVDIIDIPFKDSSLDVVIACHVLEHVRNETQALKEIFRILRSKGLAILQVPMFHKKTKEFKVSQHSNFRSYGFDFKDRLKKVGFKVKFTKLSSRNNKKFGLLSESICAVIKP